MAEFKAPGPTYQRTVKTTLRASYTNDYRAGLIKLVQVLGFSSNNTVHRPVLEALELISRYATAENLHYYPVGEHVPVHRGLGGDWEGLVSLMEVSMMIGQFDCSESDRVNGEFTVLFQVKESGFPWLDRLNQLAGEWQLGQTRCRGGAA